MNLQGNFLATGIGSVPLKDAAGGCRMIMDNFPQIPFWPQLPRRSFLEEMLVQYSEGLPGAVIQIKDKRLFVDMQKMQEELVNFYTKYLEGTPDDFAISPEYAEGLYTFLGLGRELGNTVAVKGHITGPISFGLQLTDENRRPIIYDDTMRDVLTKLLARKAQWQERQLQKLNPQTIMFIDEPSLQSFGTPFLSLSREQVIAALEEVISPLEGLVAVHCCGNTDWSLLLDTSADIISLDAYEYPEMLALYMDKLKSFLDRGGLIAWGIIPSEGPKILQEDSASLQARMENILADFSKRGIPPEKLISASLISPSCGVGSLEEPVARKVFRCAYEVSQRLREKYKL